MWKLDSLASTTGRQLLERRLTTTCIKSNQVSHAQFEVLTPFMTVSCNHVLLQGADPNPVEQEHVLRSEVQGTCQGGQQHTQL